MGNIIHKFEGFDKPQVHIKRRIDEIETQELHFNFTLAHDAWISTETGNSLNLFCRDDDGNIAEVMIPVSVAKLKEDLERF